MKEKRKLVDYIKQHPKLTLAQAVASYLKLYPGRAVSIIVDCLADEDGLHIQLAKDVADARNKTS